MEIESNREQRGSAWRVLSTLACLGLVVAAYSNFFRNSFHFDDSHVLETNLYVRSLANAPRFFTDASTFSSLPANATYRPLTTLSLAVDYALAGGLDPVVFHASQLFFLLALWAALVAFYRSILVRVVSAGESFFVALGAATLFAVHTVNTEAMNLLHCRGELLSALGVVGAFLLWQRPRLRRLQLHLVAVAAGALAKVPAVLFGPLLFVRELLVPGDEPKPTFVRRCWRAGKLAAPATVLGAALFVFTENMNRAGQSYGGPSRLSYAMTQAWAWLHYLRLFVAPFGLTADTDMPLVTGLGDTRLYAGLAAIGVLGVVAWRAARSERAWPVAFGLAWFALCLLPASSVVPLAEPVNEHRVFLPFIGLALAAVYGASLALPRRWHLAGAAALGLLLVAHAVGTHRRNAVWRTEESLWADVTVKSPANGRAWMNYGVPLMGRGDYAHAKVAFDRAAQLTPNYATLEINRAILSNALGDPNEAERLFRRALTLAPDQPAAHAFFAGWLIDHGHGPEGLAELDATLRLSPGLLTARLEVLDVHAARGDRPRLLEAARALLAIDSANARARAYAEGRIPLQPPVATPAEAFRRGLLHGSQKRWLQSALAYRAALTSAGADASAASLDPVSADALNNLGFALGSLGFFADAVAPLEEALRLRPDDRLTRNNLAWVKSAAAASANSAGHP